MSLKPIDTMLEDDARNACLVDAIKVAENRQATHFVMAAIVGMYTRYCIVLYM